VLITQRRLATLGALVRGRNGAQPPVENRPAAHYEWRAACARATCTDSTDHRTDGTHDAGIIRYAVPRTVPRPRRRGFRKEALIGVIVDRQGPDAGVGRRGAADSPAQMDSESECRQ
jgi:hypothetical protein